MNNHSTFFQNRIDHDKENTQATKNSTQELFSVVTDRIMDHPAPEDKRRTHTPFPPVKIDFMNPQSLDRIGQLRPK